jgi:hypothetical protein
LLKKPGLLTVLAGHKVLTWYFSQKQKKRVSGQTGSEKHFSVAKDGGGGLGHRKVQYLYKED